MAPPAIPQADTLTDVRLNQTVAVTGRTSTGWPTYARFGNACPVITAELSAWMDAERSRKVIAEFLGVSTRWVGNQRKFQPRWRQCPVCQSAHHQTRADRPYCTGQER